MGVQPGLYPESEARRVNFLLEVHVKEEEGTAPSSGVPSFPPSPKQDLRVPVAKAPVSLALSFF